MFILHSQLSFVDQSPLNKDFTTIFRQTLKLLHINQNISQISHAKPPDH